MAAASVGAGATLERSIETEDYYAAIPHTSDPEYVVQYEQGKAGVATASVGATADLPSTLLVDGIQYMMLDGKLSEPMSGIEYLLTGTGGGEPLPGNSRAFRPPPAVGVRWCNRRDSAAVPHR